MLTTSCWWKYGTKSRTDRVRSFVSQHVERGCCHTQDILTGSNSPHQQGAIVCTSARTPWRCNLVYLIFVCSHQKSSGDAQHIEAGHIELHWGKRWTWIDLVMNWRETQNSHMNKPQTEQDPGGRSHLTWPIVRWPSRSFGYIWFCNLFSSGLG